MTFSWADLLPKLSQDYCSSLKIILFVVQLPSSIPLYPHLFLSSCFRLSRLFLSIYLSIDVLIYLSTYLCFSLFLTLAITVCLFVSLSVSLHTFLSRNFCFHPPFLTFLSVSTRTFLSSLDAENLHSQPLPLPYRSPFTTSSGPVRPPSPSAAWRAHLLFMFTLLHCCEYQGY